MYKAHTAAVMHHNSPHCKYNLVMLIYKSSIQNTVVDSAILHDNDLEQSANQS